MLIFVAAITRRSQQTADFFLVANRSVDGVYGAMSIAASWIWAPALFISTHVGYQWGYSALVWFVIPNMCALILFGWVAPKIKHRHPQGYSYIESLKTYGGGFRITQLSVQMAMQVVILALQLTAGTELMSFVTGASYPATLIIMTTLPLAYSLRAGLYSSILTDAVQYGLIVLAIGVVACGFPYQDIIETTETIIFDPFESAMLMRFGIPSAFGLSLAIFADHQQWQRIFALQKEQETKTFISAALLHGFVTLSLGTLGVAIALTGFTPDDPQLTGAAFIAASMPKPFLMIFIYMALCGLCSTIDSAFCAAGSLYATEISDQSNKIFQMRKAMIAIACLGLLLAFVRVSIETLWFLAATIRLAAFAPTVFSIMEKRYDGLTGTLSILSGLTIGGSIFISGIMAADPWLKMWGMIAAVGVSLAVSVFRTKYRIRRWALFKRVFH